MSSFNLSEFGYLYQKIMTEFSMVDFLKLWEISKAVCNEEYVFMTSEDKKIAEHAVHSFRGLSILVNYQYIDISKIFPINIVEQLNNPACSMLYISCTDLALGYESDANVSNEVKETVVSGLNNVIDELKERCASCEDLSHQEVVQKSKDFYKKIFSYS